MSNTYVAANANVTLCVNITQRMYADVCAQAKLFRVQKMHAFVDRYVLTAALRQATDKNIPNADAKSASYVSTPT